MLPSVFDTCDSRQEIRAGNLSVDLFAAKLRLVVEGKAPQVYQQPEAFFENTFPTDGLKTLSTEVFGRLTGKIIGSPVIRLETSTASKLNFRVDRGQRTSGIIDFHLPINTPLSVVDIA